MNKFKKYTIIVALGLSALTGCAGGKTTKIMAVAAIDEPVIEDEKCWHENTDESGICLDCGEEAGVIIGNPDFNRVQFEAVKNDAGLNRFVMTPTKWIDQVNSIGIVSKAGRYGGGTFYKCSNSFDKKVITEVCECGKSYLSFSILPNKTYIL